MIHPTVHCRIVVVLVATTLVLAICVATTAGDELTSSTATNTGSAKEDTSSGNSAAGIDADKEVVVTHNLAETKAHKEISFVQQIAPLLLSRCSACHGDRDVQSGYSVFSYERMMKPGSSGSAPIVPGSVDESYFFDLVSAKEPDLWMPHHKPRLVEDEIRLLREWIESGAKFDGKEATAPLWQLVPTITYAPPSGHGSRIPVTAITFNSDGEQLAIGGLHEIVIIQSRTGEVIRRISNVAERTYDLAFHPGTGQLVAATGTPGGLGEVRVFDPATGDFVRELVRLADVALGVAFDSAGARLACCGADRTIRIHDFASGEQLLVAQHHSDWVYHVAFSADGNRIVSASRDMTAKVIDAKTGDLVTTYNGHQAPVRDAAFLPNGNQAASCGDDNKIHIWTTAATGKVSAMSESPQDEKKVAEIAGFGHHVFRLAISGDSIFGASADARAHQFLTDSRQHQRVVSAGKYPIYALSVHGPTQRVATGGHDGRVRIWSIATGELLAECQP
jgi:WD40 repeat protein